MNASAQTSIPSALPALRSLLLGLGLSGGMIIASWSLAWSIPMLPYLAGAYSTSLDHAVWSLTFYLVAWALGAVPATWLYRRIGELRSFQLSIALLLVATLPDVLSDHFSLFLLGRFFQGLAAGFLTPLVRRLLIRYAPAQWQGFAADLSVVNLVLPLLAGPSLAGWIAYNWDWRTAPWLTFPVGLLSLGLCSALIPAGDSERHEAAFDWIGLALLALAAGSVQILLNRGEDWNWWDSARFQELAALAGIFCIAFFVWERHHPYPCLDLSLLKRRNFILPIPALVFGWGLLLGGNSLFVSALIAEAGYTAYLAGLVLFPMALTGVPLIAVMSRVSHWIGPRVLATICFLLVAAYGFSTQVNRSSSFNSLMLAHLIEGAALGFYLVPLSLIMFSRLPSHRLPAAATLQNFIRILGGAYMSSIFSALWLRHGSYFQAHLAWQSPTTPIADFGRNLDSKGIAGKMAIQVHMLETQSLALSMQSMLFLWGLMAVGVLILLWFTKAPFRRRPGQKRRVTIEQEIVESADLTPNLKGAIDPSLSTRGSGTPAQV